MQPLHPQGPFSRVHWLLLCFVLLLSVSAPMLLATTSGSQIGLAYRRADVVTTRIVLYDGSLNTGTPDQQDMIYLTRPQSGSASQTFANGTTTLTTTQSIGDIAGYSNNPFLMPAFNRTLGFTLHFTVQLLEEDHSGSDKNGDGIGDRAGLSVTLLGSDHKGIELGFWPGEIWAQQDGIAEPPPPGNTLFTHGEGAPFPSTTGLISYSLTIEGDSYALVSSGKTILSGPVRDYSAVPEPYSIANFVFIGDNTSTANGIIKLSNVAIDLNSAATATATIPIPSPTPTVGTIEPTKVCLLLPVIRQDER